MGPISRIRSSARFAAMALCLTAAIFLMGVMSGCASTEDVPSQASSAELPSSDAATAPAADASASDSAVEPAEGAEASQQVEAVGSSEPADASEFAEPADSTEAIEAPKPVEIRIAPGMYYIQSSLPGTLMLDVEGGSDQPGANVQIWAANASYAQCWYVDRLSDGTYTLQSAASGCYLGTDGWAAGAGANVLQNATDEESAQRWSIISVGNAFAIAAAGDERYVLDVAGALAWDGANVQLYDANGTAAQGWWFVPIEPTVPSEQAISDGVYEMHPTDAPAFCVDLDSSGYAEGANVRFWSSDSSVAKRWYVQWESDGYYSIRNVASGKLLAVADGYSVLGENVQSKADSDTADCRWAISENGDGSFTITNKANGLVLDTGNGDVWNGANVCVWARANGCSQQYALKAVELLPEGAYTMYSLIAPTESVVGISDASAPAKASVQFLADDGSMEQRLFLHRVAKDTYMIQSVCSGLYLADSSGKVVQEQYSGDDAQRWTVQMEGGGFAFANVATGNRLAADDEAAAIGSGVSAKKSKSEDAQRFRLVNTRLLSDGYYEVHSAAASDEVLDVVGDLSKSGAYVQLYKANESAAQAWRIQSAQDGCYRISNDSSGMYLGVADGNAAAGARVCQLSQDDSAMQLWDAAMRADGTIALINKGSGLALSAAGIENGSDVCLSDKTDEASQGWSLVAIGQRNLTGDAELDAYIRSIIDQNGDDMARCFEWLANMRGVRMMDDAVNVGIVGEQDMAKYARYVMERGESDCYGASALFAYIARAFGYDAYFRGGDVLAGNGVEEHGWTELYINGVPYVCDVSLARAHRDRNFYMVTYDEAPAEYFF